MKYSAILTRRAQRDRDEAYNWYLDNYSASFAVRWYNGLHDTLQTLEINSSRCPLARENGLLPFEVRELLYGRHRKNHCILFTIYKKLAVVLHIRHSAQQDLVEEDL